MKARVVLCLSDVRCETKVSFLIIVSIEVGCFKDHSTVFKILSREGLYICCDV